MERKYGICSWLLNKDDPEILLDSDLEDFEKLNPHGKVFNVLPYDEEYCSIRYGNRGFIIKMKAIRLIDSDVLEIGQLVEDKNKSDRKGRIVERMWHFKNMEAFYYVDFGNKISSKRYFIDDLHVLDH